MEFVSTNFTFQPFYCFNFWLNCVVNVMWSFGPACLFCWPHYIIQLQLTTQGKTNRGPRKPRKRTAENVVYCSVKVRYNWHANYRVVEQEKIEIYRKILLSTGPKVDGERYQCNCSIFFLIFFQYFSSNSW